MRLRALKMRRSALIVSENGYSSLWSIARGDKYGKGQERRSLVAMSKLNSCLGANQICPRDTTCILHDVLQMDIYLHFYSCRHQMSVCGHAISLPSGIATRKRFVRRASEQTLAHLLPASHVTAVLILTRRVSPSKSSPHFNHCPWCITGSLSGIATRPHFWK